MLRRTFGPMREEVAGGWRRLRNEELHNLYTSLYIIVVIESRRMRWALHVARMGYMINTTLWSENLKGGDHSEDIRVDGKTLLEWILGKWGGNV
jgi:hypothetical protein